MKKIIILYFIRLSVSNENSNVMDLLQLNNPITIEQKLTNIPPISKFQQFLNDNASVSKTAKVCEFIFLLGRFLACLGFMFIHEGFFLIFGVFMSFTPKVENQIFFCKNTTLKIFGFYIFFAITSLLITVPFIVKILWKKRIQWNWVNIIKYILWGSLIILILIFFSIINYFNKLRNDTKNNDPHVIEKILCWSTFIINIILLINSIVSLFFGTNSLDNPTTSLDNPTTSQFNTNKRRIY